jgi:hypothetical protein
MTEEICLLAVSSYGKALEYVPEEFMTKELCFAAVQQNRKALKYTDVSLLSAEEYTAICRIAMVTDTEFGQ